ncbi:MAG TPA: Asp-tRNA(Asn)/Glu-tRNA(Gln) amidotransferase subunit GatB [bacterium]|nr:Asp-tRNA(Asn)/Glu-tRNA(Gln) amidotransferase subunit GatB [bacterium]
MKELKTTIGLEIHVQLKTKSKMFCRCDNNAEGKAPNTVVCPVCLGLPGALPVANKQAIEWTVKTGLAINSTIPKIAKFDRKHYFYPDLPKGYQISQYDEPFCQGGTLEIPDPGPQNQEKSQNQDSKAKNLVTIRFNRVHLEEDAGKLIHFNGKSLVDLNRAGTPLMEMVTEPDITSPKQAGDFLRRLQKLVRDEVQVSDADMEKGHMRCDANISVCDGEVESGKFKVKRMSEIVEIKNLNSFRFVEKALTLEEERLRAEYPNWPEKKGKVTRGYDSDKNITYVQRTKEEAADYRYFPEPDVPPIDLSKFDLEEMKKTIRSSFAELVVSYSEAGIPENMAKTIADSDIYRHIVDQAIASGSPAKILAIVANFLINRFREWKSSDAGRIKEILRIAEYFDEGSIAKPEAAELLSGLDQEGFDLAHIENKVEESKKAKGESGQRLEKIIEDIIGKFPDEYNSYQTGKKQLLGFFMGQLMKETGGKIDSRAAATLLKNTLDEDNQGGSK